MIMDKKPIKIIMIIYAFCSTRRNFDVKKHVAFPSNYATKLVAKFDSVEFNASR